ncbi:MAG: carboxypeptidase-like regulatory domain-containing protein [Bacteroidota bacterium]
MRLLLIAALLLATPCVLAQDTGKIVGTVMDDTGTPLPGANVLLDETNKGAATNLDGEYVIPDVPPGTYEVTASFVGFESRTRSVVLTVETEATQDFVLESDGSVDDLCVCCGYRPIISNDIYAPTVLTGEEIARLPVGW